MRDVPPPIESEHDNPSENNRLQSVEIDHPEIHTVDVYERRDGSRYAIPFVHRDTFDDGSIWLDEPHPFEPDDVYRDALEAAGIDTGAVDLDREIPTVHLGEVGSA